MTGLFTIKFKLPIQLLLSISLITGSLCLAQEGHRYYSVYDESGKRLEWIFAANTNDFEHEQNGAWSTPLQSNDINLPHAFTEANLSFSAMTDSLAGSMDQPTIQATRPQLATLVERLQSNPLIISYTARSWFRYGLSLMCCLRCFISQERHEGPRIVFTPLHYTIDINLTQCTIMSERLDRLVEILEGMTRQGGVGLKLLSLNLNDGRVSYTLSMYSSSHFLNRRLINQYPEVTIREPSTEAINSSDTANLIDNEGLQEGTDLMETCLDKGHPM